MEFVPHSLTDYQNEHRIENSIISKDQKVLFQVLWTKIALITFFFPPSKQGVIHKKFVPAAKTANTEVCVLERLLK